jgi:hypothetical protein
MSESVSPCIAEGLERIQTGWRVRYTPECEWPWEVFADRLDLGGYELKNVGVIFDTADEAKAEYLRLTTEKREKGK